ncbi:hypothetical protein BDC45DRAFT_570275 [Circinella umbellata]|nr:hypothetical protein BDC45DRAFT_570275 [Circinella umbellata]
MGYVPKTTAPAINRPLIYRNCGCARGMIPDNLLDAITKMLKFRTLDLTDCIFDLNKIYDALNILERRSNGSSTNHTSATTTTTSSSSLLTTLRFKNKSTTFQNYRYSSG